MLKGFKTFILRGNIIDLAVGIAIGAAFGALVASFNKAIIDPIVKLALRPLSSGKTPVGNILIAGDDGKPNAIYLGISDLILAILTFLITAAAIYFVVVVPLNKLNERRKRGEVEVPAEISDEVKLLTSIRDLLASK